MTYKYNPPQHYTLENLCYLLKKYPVDRLLITEKADGIYQCDTIDDYGECEYEYVEQTNKKYIFNSKNNIIREPKYYDELKEIIIQDRNETINKSIINKPYYRLNNYLIEYLDELIDFKNNIYATDGWIIICDQFRDLTLKLKPLEHMTIDLYYNKYKNRWLTRENKSIDIPTDMDIPSGIWRLYWKNYKWVPEDRRYDKKKANSYKIVKYIIDFIHKPFKIYDVIEMLSKQELYYETSINLKSQATCEYIKYNNQLLQNIIKKYCNDGMKVLDIGCGKGKYVIENILWFGIDKDLGALYKPNNRYDNFTGIWLDFTKQWDPIKQNMWLGNLWCYYKNSLYELKQNKFDVVLWLYSIHFCYTFEQLKQVFEEINNLTKSDSLLILNLVKKDFKYIKTSNGYINRTEDVLVRYYDWCNIKESIEKIWDIKDIMLASGKWYVYDIIDFDDIDNEWNEWHKNNYICVMKKI
jgi:SAM-dependent methyltransferase